MALPQHYRAASFRSVGQPDDEFNVVGLALDAGAACRRADRYRLDLDDAERMAFAVIEAVNEQRQRAMRAGIQSLISVGSPNRDGSPQDGQAPYPPAKSSSACCADRNGPSKRSSSSATIQPRLASAIRNVPALVRYAYAVITGRPPVQSPSACHCAGACAAGFATVPAATLLADEVDSYTKACGDGATADGRPRYVRAPFSREFIECICNAFLKDDCGCIQAHLHAEKPESDAVRASGLRAAAVLTRSATVARRLTAEAALLENKHQADNAIAIEDLLSADELDALDGRSLDRSAGAEVVDCSSIVMSAIDQPFPALSPAQWAALLRLRAHRARPLTADEAWALAEVVGGVDGHF